MNDKILKKLQEIKLKISNHGKEKLSHTSISLQNNKHLASSIEYDVMVLSLLSTRWVQCAYVCSIGLVKFHGK